MARSRESFPHIPRSWARLPYVARVTAGGWTGSQVYSFAKRVAASYGFSVEIEYPEATSGRFAHPGRTNGGVLVFSKDTVKDTARSLTQRRRALGLLGVCAALLVVGVALSVQLPRPLDLVGLALAAVGGLSFGYEVPGFQDVYGGSFVGIILRLPSSQTPRVRTMADPITAAGLAIVGGRTLTIGRPGTYFTRIRSASADAECELIVSRVATGMKGSAPSTAEAVSH